MFWKKPPPGLRPRWMIVGLGNPGGEYKGTRHNVGFEVVERLALANKIKLDRAKHRGLTGIGLVQDTPVLIVKPLTFMNLSGQCVAPLARDNEIPANRILVVADDLNLEVGKLRLREDGSAGGHNGHKSLIGSLHTQSYPRLKIGIGKGKDSTIDHVLSTFGKDERDVIAGAIQASVDVCEAVVTRDWASALMVVDDWNKRGS